MSYSQADLFAQDDAERNTLPESRRAAIRSRLEATLARLEATGTFPWRDPLEAVHEENRFQRDTEMLGEEGALLWARFDKEIVAFDAADANKDGQVTAEERAAQREAWKAKAGEWRAKRGAQPAAPASE